MELYCITGHENGDLCQWELKVGGIVLDHRTREQRLMSVGAEGWWNCTVCCVCESVKVGGIVLFAVYVSLSRLVELYYFLYM